MEAGIISDVFLEGPTDQRFQRNSTAIVCVRQLSVRGDCDAILHGVRCKEVCSGLQLFMPAVVATTSSNSSSHNTRNNHTTPGQLLFFGTLV